MASGQRSVSSRLKVSRTFRLPQKVPRRLVFSGCFSFLYRCICTSCLNPYAGRPNVNTRLHYRARGPSYVEVPSDGIKLVDLSKNPIGVRGFCTILSALENLNFVGHVRTTSLEHMGWVDEHFYVLHHEEVASKDRFLHF